LYFAFVQWKTDTTKEKIFKKVWIIATVDVSEQSRESTAAIGVIHEWIDNFSVPARGAMSSSSAVLFDEFFEGYLISIDKCVRGIFWKGRDISNWRRVFTAKGLHH
jgi:hypothetical protein